MNRELQVRMLMFDRKEGALICEVIVIGKVKKGMYSHSLLAWNP